MSQLSEILVLVGLLVFSLLVLQASGAVTISPIQRIARLVPESVRHILFVLDDLAKSRAEFAEARSPRTDLALRILGGAAGVALAVGALVGIASAL